MRLFFSFLFALIGLLSGIYSIWYFLLVIPVLLYLVCYQKRKREVFVYLGFAILFFLVSFFYPKSTNETIDSYGVVIKSKESYFLIQTLKGRFYVSEMNNSVSFLTILHVKGSLSSLSFSHYESGFSFRDYLNSQGIFAELNIKESNTVFSLFKKENPIRDYLLLYSNDISRPFIESFLFQESIYSEESLSSLNRLGVLNLFSLSGFHLSFLFRVLEKTLGEKRKKLSLLIEIVILIFFCYLSSFSYTLRRLMILAILKVVNEYTEHKIDYLSRVSLTGIIMLFVEPYSLSSPTFYYAFPLLISFALFPRKKDKRKSIHSRSIVGFRPFIFRTI